ncbi:MAG: universal stress protein [Acidobacteria bacterium]|nr:universal stress protein [Acidobacteriota bacterium]
MTVLAPPRIAIKQILFPTDFSEASTQALPHAINIAQQYESRIHLVHVLLPVEWQVDTGAVPLGTYELGLQQAKQRMAQFINNGRFNGVEYDSAVRPGLGIGETVSELVGSKEIDLVVVGTSGREGLHRLFAGSVAEQVFRMVSCPVMVVGPRAARRAPRKFHTLMFATDLTRDSLLALPFVLGFTDDHHARLIVTHVPPYKHRQLGVEEATRKRMSDLIPAHEKVGYEVPFGEPADAILRVAEERQCDLIMLGAHHANPFSTHLRSNFVHRVVDEAYCPVLIVQAHNGE